MFRRIPWQDVCKFLAGAFFETSGILFYLWLYRISDADLWHRLHPDA